MKVTEGGMYLYVKIIEGEYVYFTLSLSLVIKWFAWKILFPSN